MVTYTFPKCRLWQGYVNFLCGAVYRLCFFKKEMATGFQFLDLERLLEEAAKDVTPREKDKVLLIFFF